VEQFWFIEPVAELQPGPEFMRVATDRPHGYALGSSTMEEIQRMACLADMAGRKVVLVETKRPSYGDSVCDLYISLY